MEPYSKSGRPSIIGVHHSDDLAASTPCVGAGFPPLVNTSISQKQPEKRNPVKSLLVYPRAVKIVRESTCPVKPVPPSVRREIESFSLASRRRLKFTASNAFPALISQFGLTYHNAEPDGRTCKKHLNLFLTTLRQKYPNVRYLWILEFQRRGTAHFHIFLSLPHDPATGKTLAKIWHRIAEPESPEHLRFHEHHANFIPWSMGSGSYLCKYLDKEAQKSVPTNFAGVGRFWGNSRGIVPTPAEFDTACMKSVLGEKETLSVIRTVCRHHEASYRRSRWKKSPRKRKSSYTLPNGAVIVHRLVNALSEIPMTDSEIQDLIDPIPF